MFPGGLLHFGSLILGNQNPALDLFEFTRQAGRIEGGQKRVKQAGINICALGAGMSLVMVIKVQKLSRRWIGPEIFHPGIPGGRHGDSFCPAERNLNIV